MEASVALPPECGTMRAVWRHHANKEPLDEACRRARVRYQAELRNRSKAHMRAEGPPAEHGTVERYYHHRAYRKPMCVPCLLAWKRAQDVLDEDTRLAVANVGTFLRLLKEARGDRQVALENLRQILLHNTRRTLLRDLRRLLERKRRDRNRR